MRALRVVGALAVTLGLGASGGCNAVLSIPDPTLAPHATCADGACVCEAGFADCDDHLADDCATDLGTDPRHCGACGHDCLGGGCKGGKCQPIVLATIDGARGLSLHGGSVLVGTCDGSDKGDAFLKVPVGGGAALTAVRSNHCGVAQVLLGDTLYWSDTSTLLGTHLPPAGAPAFVSSGSAWKVVASTTHVYWGQLDDQGTNVGVMRLALGGGAPEHVFPTETHGIAADEQGVYWVDDGGVYALADGSSTPSGPIDPPGIELALDAQRFYVGARTGGIQAVPRDGGTSTVLVAEASASYITTDATTLFWLDDAAGSVNQVPLAGGAPTVLATDFSFTGTSAIAVDAAAVYWLSGTVIAKVAR